MQQPPMPQPPPDGAQQEDWEGALDDFTLGEKTEKRWPRLWPWQWGHSASRPPMISASKLWSQSLQTYSKIGIVVFRSFGLSVFQ